LQVRPGWLFCLGTKVDVFDLHDHHERANVVLANEAKEKTTMNKDVKQAKGAAPAMAAEMNDSIQGGTMLEAQARLARMAQRMGGVMAESGMWFDLPNNPNVVGYGIIHGQHGVAIVSVVRD
jgi:ferredoxin